MIERSFAFKEPIPLRRYFSNAPLRVAFGAASRTSAFAANSFFISAVRSMTSIWSLMLLASASIASNFDFSSAFKERPSFCAASTIAVAPLISSARCPRNSMFFIVLKI